MQSEAIPLILGGGDVLMAAETGSGKTGAFCLPVLPNVLLATNRPPDLVQVLQITWESLKELQEGKGRGQGGGKAKREGADK